MRLCLTSAARESSPPGTASRSAAIARMERRPWPAASMREDFERLRTRALSTSEHLSENEIEEGFAAIEAALQAIGDHPVVTRGDLLIFER
jgi:hypothetical protein